ncbi:MAG: Hsp20/alpha crystallin family protein [Acholeplasmatales bacterium]
MKRNRDFFEDFFNDFNVTTPSITNALMKTDIKETKKGYELLVDLPGIQKEDVKVSIENGYLQIEAEIKQENDEKDADSKYIRRERYYGQVKRSYYVGDISIDDVKGSFKDGVLKIQIPKEVKKVQEKKYLEL